MRADDLPRMVDLFLRVLRPKRTPAELGFSTFEEFFSSMLLRHPWSGGTSPSIVYEDREGQIRGSLGVIERSFEFGGRTVTICIGSSFVVEPEARFSLAGVEMVQRLFRGPQDITIAEASNLTRRVWSGLGGVFLPTQSLFWRRLLRPSALADSQKLKKPSMAALRWTARPLLRMADSLTGGEGEGTFSLRRVEWAGEPLTGETFVEGAKSVFPEHTIRPRYSAEQFHWLLELADRKSNVGPMRQVAVRDERGRLAGWYVYYAPSKGAGQTLELAARAGAEGPIIDHLLHDAYEHGLASISGRAEPYLLPDLSDRGCRIRCEQPWSMVHAKSPELMSAFHRGDVRFSNLDGEWWLFW